MVDFCNKKIYNANVYKCGVNCTFTVKLFGRNING